MNTIVISTLILPGVVALLLFLVFTYLHEQSRQPYFRAWHLGWAAYTLHFLLDALSSMGAHHAALSFAASLLLVAMAVCILISTRLTRRITSAERREAFRPRWYELLVAVGCIGLACSNLQPPLTHAPLWLGITADSWEMGLADGRRTGP